ncbi:cytochrome P450 [Apiospora rasikravindrae]|uniref:Cytochrome P450 n=1 Tax=Apiospora rasikravindrae TaxID=990691 RepID=A0ABR1SZE3_9PEZI
MFDTNALSSVRTLPEALGITPSYLLVCLASCMGLALLSCKFVAATFKSPASPQKLRDPVPGIYNTLQFMLNNHKFMTRAQAALQRGRHSILRFSLGPKTVYLVAGQQNVRAVFGRDLVHDVTNQDQMTRYALPTLYKMNPAEVRRWEADRSGVMKTPIPGTEDVPARQRLWYNYEHIYAEYLGKPQYMKPLIKRYDDNLQRVLSSYPLDEWSSVSVQKLCRDEVTRTLVNTLFGPRLMELNPDFVDRLWAFDEQVFQLVMGLPKWLNSKPAKAHDAYVDPIERWLEYASSGFDWDAADAEADWEPRFGGRAVRELYRWMKETDWRNEVIAATLGALVFALNSNSVPTTMWMLMEIIKDPDLLQAIREEVSTATTTDADSGKLVFEHQKVVALPLLQSIWTETLRLRINFNIVRDVKQPVTLDNGNTTIEKGALIQVPMMVAHYDESVWGAADHPASEFWAERHIRYSGGERKYVMAGHPAAYFPFGGGANICPGRQLAKHEIFTTAATIVSRFELEVLGWTNPADGSHSDRAAESDLRYCGAGAMPPDRDLKVRWKRIR